MKKTKFLLNGQKVLLIKTVENGFLVQNLYSDGEEEFTDDKTFFIDKVFDAAPTEVLDDRILELDKVINEKIVKRDSITNELFELKKSYENKKKIFTNYSHPAINLLENYLENKITHFVVCQYGVVEIYDRKSLFYYESDFRLNFEINFTSNEIKWSTYYKANSYDMVECFPCSSLDQAMNIVNDIFKKAWEDVNMTWSNSFINSAKELKIEIPEYYQKNILERNKKSIELSISNLRKQLDEKEKELEIMNL